MLSKRLATQLCLTLTAQNRTLDKDSALDQQLAEDVRRSTRPVESQEAQDYVARLGGRLTGQLPSPDRAYTFSTVSTDESNALHEPLATPDGYIFVPSSLLLAANDEAEFAGMLAQAITRESLLRVQTNAGRSAGTIPVIFIDSFSNQRPAAYRCHVSATRSGASSRYDCCLGDVSRGV